MNKIKVVQNQDDFDNLINSVYQTHYLLQENAVKTINYNLTVRNWLISHYIVEYEQNGKNKAQYGASLLNEIVKQIKNKGIKGLNSGTLRTCRTFYNFYPQFHQTVSDELRRLAFDHNVLLPNKSLPIWGSVTAKFQDANNQKKTLNTL